MEYKFLAIWAILPFFNALAMGQNENLSTDLLKGIFPESTFPDSGGVTDISLNYSPSRGPWPAYHNEKLVFQAGISHKDGVDNSFNLRVGKGGQIYSIQGKAGEYVPPSFPQGAPWMDEVWQFVSVCSKYNMIDFARKRGPLQEIIKPYAMGYFIHNSGYYMDNEWRVKHQLDSPYAPLFAFDCDKKTRSYRQLNWGVVPQVQTINRSPLLYYMQVKDLGSGIIELTWLVYNFDTRQDLIFDHLNAPWGGTRFSVLPHYALSDNKGDFYPYAGYKDTLIVDGRSVDDLNVEKTGGFDVNSATGGEASPALAFVFGRDKHLADQLRRKSTGQEFVQYAPSIYRATWFSGISADWQKRPQESFRNYHVQVVIPKFNIHPGKGIWYRSYLVVHHRKVAIETARKLVDHVDYGVLDISPESAPLKTITFPGGRKGNLFMQPVNGSMPVFHLQHRSTKREYITTDPYFIFKKEKIEIEPEILEKITWHNNPDINKDRLNYVKNAIGYTVDGTTIFKGLLGFGLKECPGKGWIKLSEKLGKSQFGEPTQFHVDVWIQDRQAE